MGVRRTVLSMVVLSFVAIVPLSSFAGSGLIGMIEAQIGAAEEVYNALLLQEMKSVSGDVHFSYKATLNPSHMNEGGLYCERRSSTDCSLVSNKGLKGKVVVLEGGAAEKIFNAINPSVAKIQYVSAETSYYQVGGLTCMRSLQKDSATYTCTASSF